jgi:ABC-type multidrug transport system ATPase subunit
MNIAAPPPQQHSLRAPSARPIGEAPAPAVSIEGVSKAYVRRRALLPSLLHPRSAQSVTVLNDITLSAEPGEIVALLGPNGAGKTTLLKILAGLVLPDAGRVRFFGHDVVRDAASARRLVAPVLTDERSLFWRVSAGENLRLYAALHGIAADESRRRIAQTLDLVGLGATGTQRVAEFSSGMKQRLLIARALIATPRVLLLDEPTRSLDPVLARDIREFIRTQLCGRLHCAVLLATHSAEEALELADRTAVIDRGRLLALGRPAELLSDFAEHRYVIWSRADRAPFARLESAGVITSFSRIADRDGWPCWQVETGSLDSAAVVITALVGAGVEVARCERAPMPLHELLERVGRRGTGEGAAA